jgi:hypothetical protein
LRIEVTTGGERKAGDKVNIEVDQMARYAARLIEAGQGGSERSRSAANASPAEVYQTSPGRNSARAFSLRRRSSFS